MVLPLTLVRELLVRNQEWRDLVIWWLFSAVGVYSSVVRAGVVGGRGKIITPLSRFRENIINHQRGAGSWLCNPILLYLLTPPPDAHPFTLTLVPIQSLLLLLSFYVDIIDMSPYFILSFYPRVCFSTYIHCLSLLLHDPPSLQSLEGVLKELFVVVLLMETFPVTERVCDLPNWTNSRGKRRENTIFLVWLCSLVFIHYFLLSVERSRNSDIVPNVVHH